jgi:hypothetical protein
LLYFCQNTQKGRLSKSAKRLNKRLIRVFKRI